MKGQERELKKISDDKYLLIIDDKKNKLRQEKGYSKAELKEQYASVRMQRLQMAQSIAAAKKNLKGLDMAPLTSEEEKIALAIEKVTKKVERDKKEAELEALKEQEDFAVTAMKELENALPELKRS